MIEGLVIAVSLVAFVVIVVGGVIGTLFNLLRSLPTRDRLMWNQFGTICPYCSHNLDMTDRKTLRSYDAGKCPSCNHDLLRMSDGED